jgi:hypothetical protein
MNVQNSHLSMNSGQEQDNNNNTFLGNNMADVNWRSDVSTADRTRFINQLSSALKCLSPNASDNEAYTVATNYEAGLFQRCTNKVNSHTHTQKLLILMHSHIARMNTSWLVQSNFNKYKTK